MRPDLIYLTHRVPYPPDRGDRIRNYHVLRWLSGRAAVHLASLADEPVTAEQRAELGRMCERVAIHPVGGRRRWARAALSLARGRTASEGAHWAPALGETVDRWAGQTRFQSALVSASSLVPYLRRGALRGVPAVVDLVDVDSQKWLDYASRAPWPGSALYRLEGRRLRGLEVGLAAWARATTLVSAAEAGLFRDCGGSGAIRAIVNGVDLEYFRPSPSPSWVEGSGCVFVGALDYRPNVDGLAWFCREAWPGVRRRRPDAVLRLVGRRPSAAARRLAEGPGIELVGEVPDVRPHLGGAAVAIAPLRMARGVQNKVLEALAMGKAAVISPEARTGLDLEPGVQALVASAPGEWVEAIVGLLDDADRRRRLGAEGRRFVERHHRWDRCLEPFGALLGLVSESPPVIPSTSISPASPRETTAPAQP